MDGTKKITGRKRVLSNSYLSNVRWQENTKNNVGLPRPYSIVAKELHFKKPHGFNNPFKRYLHKIVPIPWQSESAFELGGLLKLNQTNEAMVVSHGLCSYCGLGFDEDEICIRWKTQDRRPSSDGLGGFPRVVSDSYPLHPECMSQARTFCPYMRTLKDEDFEIGEYDQLRKRAARQVKFLMYNK